MVVRRWLLLQGTNRRWHLIDLTADRLHFTSSARSFLSRAVFFAWLIWLVGSVNSSITPLMAYDEQRLGEFIVLAMTLLLPAAGPRIPVIIHRTLIILIGLGLLSSLLSTHIRPAVAEWSLLAACLLSAPALAGHLERCGLRWRFWIFAAVIITCIAYLVGAMASWLAGLLAHASWQPALMLHHFDNPRFFAQWALLVLPLLYCLEPTTTFRRRGLSLLRAGLLMLMLASGSRGALLALLLAAGWLLVILTRRTALPAASATPAAILVKQLSRRFVTDAILGMLLYIFLFYIAPWLTTAGNPAQGSASLLRNSTSGRLLLWHHAWLMIAQHPWLGSGPGSFAGWTNPFGAHPHDFILQIAAEWGLPACFAFMSFLGISLYHWLTKLRYTQPESILLAWSLLAGLLLGLVDGMLVTPVSQTMLVLVTAWALASHSANKPQSPTHQSSPQSQLWLLHPASRVLLVCVLIASNAPGLFYTWQSETSSHAKRPVMEHPRIWTDGTSVHLN